MLFWKRKPQPPSEAAALILVALAKVPGRMWQRVDGLRCDKGVIDLSRGEFSRAMRGLLALGLVETRASQDMRPLPLYRLCDPIRAITMIPGKLAEPNMVCSREETEAA